MTDSPDFQPTDAPSRRSLRENSGARRRGPARSPSASPAASSGIRGLIAKHPTAWLASALGVAFLLLGTGAVFAGIASGSGSALALPIAGDDGPPPRPQPSAFPLSSALRTCSVASIAADPNLGAFAGNVINATSGETLFDRNGAAPQAPANVLQLITAAAALQILGPNGQLSTKVVDGSSPGTIVLVGGGDPTLATTSSTIYQGAPLISDLADAAMAKYATLHPGVPVNTIVLDSTMWDPSDKWDPSWPESERTNGYQAQVTALMVDGDRDDPTEAISPRSTDPIARAGEAFADAAGLNSVTFTRGSAVGSTVLAEVRSQPISTLIGQMLPEGDNTLAEMLARVVSKTMGLNGSSASLAQGIPVVLTDLGMTATNKLVIKDGSGESPQNSVPPLFISQLLAKVKANDQNLGLIYSSMPVGGQSGDLADRFTGANAIAGNGAVVAKPGWITNERSLAGIVIAADGTSLAFSFYGLGDAISSDTKQALDSLVTGLYSCGNNLSTN